MEQILERRKQTYREISEKEAMLAQFGPGTPEFDWHYAAMMLKASIEGLDDSILILAKAVDGLSESP